LKELKYLLAPLLLPPCCSICNEIIKPELSSNTVKPRSEIVRD
jgi:hypothetical protein